MLQSASAIVAAGHVQMKTKETMSCKVTVITPVNDPVRATVLNLN